MKATGIVRKVDNLGRLCLPVELRRTLEMTDNESIEIYVDKDRIILKKYEPSCIFCGSMENVECFESKRICKKCMIRISIGGN